MMFLFAEPHLHRTAYFIIPDKDGEVIHHQYGCVMCDQWEEVGRIEIVPEELAEKLVELIGCHYASPETIRAETGLEVEYVLGESLAKLKDGRYVATSNCD